MADEELFQAFIEALNLDKIFIASDLLEQVKQGATKSSVLEASLEEHADAVERCEAGYQRVRHLLDELNSDDGWKLEKKRGGTTVHSKKEEGSPFITTKATTLIPVENRGDLPQAFVRLLALFAETDLMPAWFPNKLMHSNKTVHEISLFSKFTHMKFHPPALAPISKRDGIAFGSGYDLTERGEVAIAYETLTSGQEFHGYTVPDASSKYVRIEAKGAYYLAVAEGGIIFKTLAMTDLKLSFVPTMVLNWIARNGPFDYVSTVKKKFLQFEGSEWAQRVSNRPELYEDLLTRVSNSLDITVSAVEDAEKAPSTKKNRGSSVLKRMSRGRKRRSRKRSSTKRVQPIEETTWHPPTEEAPTIQITQLTDWTATVVTMVQILPQFLDALYESIVSLIPEGLTDSANKLSDAINDLFGQRNSE